MNENTIIEDNCYINNAEIGKNNKILNNCYINGLDKITKIGNNNIFKIGVIVTGDVIIGDNNKFFHYAIIGGEANWQGDIKIGKLIIGNNNIFKERVTIQHWIK